MEQLTHQRREATPVRRDRPRKAGKARQSTAHRARTKQRPTGCGVRRVNCAIAAHESVCATTRHLRFGAKMVRARTDCLGCARRREPMTGFVHRSGPLNRPDRSGPRIAAGHAHQKRTRKLKHPNRGVKLVLRTAVRSGSVHTGASAASGIHAKK